MKRSQYYSPDEVATLRRVATDLSARGRAADVVATLVVECALELGLRVNELARLKLGDFDLTRGSVRVYRSKRGKPSWDSLPVSKRLAQVILGRMRQAGSISPEDPVFVGQRGPMTRRGLQQAWLRVVKASGLPRLSIHGARHTLGTNLRRASGSLHLVQEVLGHSSINTTARYYDHIEWDEKAAAMESTYGE